MKREWFHRNWHWITIIGVAVISFLVYLGWKLGIAISFAVLSILVATFFASRSLKLTQDSLVLTRATARPFLNIYQFDVNWSKNDGQPTPVNNFIFGFCNTGAFPADQVSVLIKVSKNKMDNQQSLFAVSEGIPPICFPSEEIPSLLFREVDEKEKLEVELKGKLKVRIEIEYKNKLTQETYKTNRSYLVQYNPTARGVPTPLPKEDYWD